MIPRESAIRITSDSFPNGPEELAKALSVIVSASPLVGVEGWCLRGVNTIVRVNSSSTKTRQRFTLAHELAHLILGTEPDVASEPFRSAVREEREADQLASEFLIPDSHLKSYLQDRLPVDAKTIARLANTANVSPLMAACRVVNAAGKLGLKNAAAVFFKGGVEQWRYSNGLQLGDEIAQLLWRDAVEQSPNLVRINSDDGNTLVGSIIDAQVYQVLLMQLLPEDEAKQESYDEKLGRLARFVFAGDYSFQQSVAASLGTVKRRCEGQSLSQAFAYFMKNYPGVKYKGDNSKSLQSERGQEYIRLYLQRWFN